MSKLDLRPIVADHWETLRDMGSDRTSMTDIGWFFAVPVIGAAALVWCRLLLADDTIVVLITAFSIFAGLLLNLLLLTHGIITAQGDAPRSKRRLALVREVYRNISYAILVSLVTVAVLVIVAIIGSSPARWVGSLAVYFLVAHFLLTLLMILKRVHVMLAKEYESANSEGPVR